MLKLWQFENFATGNFLVSRVSWWKNDWIVTKRYSRMWTRERNLHTKFQLDRPIIYEVIPFFRCVLASLLKGLSVYRSVGPLVGRLRLFNKRGKHITHSLPHTTEDASLALLALFIFGWLVGPVYMHRGVRMHLKSLVEKSLPCFMFVQRHD